MSTRSNFSGQASHSCVTSMVTTSRRNNNNVVPRTVEVQHRNSFMLPDLLFLDMGTINTKPSHIDLVTSPPILESSCALPPAQKNVLTAHRCEDTNFDSLNFYPSSEMTNE